MSEVHTATRSNRSLSNRQRIALGMSDEIAAIEALTSQHLVTLGENSIRSLDDLADLASDELIEIVGVNNMTKKAADAIIMTARAHWFK